MLYRRYGTFSRDPCQQDSCEDVVDGNLGALMNVVIIYRFWELAFVQIAQKLIALFRIGLIYGDLSLGCGTAESSHCYREKLRAEQ